MLSPGVDVAGWFSGLCVAGVGTGGTLALQYALFGPTGYSTLRHGISLGGPLPADWEEPERVARSVKLMKLKHAVITSVDRDDLEDRGSGIWALTIKKVKEENPGTSLEVLIPDFKGKIEALKIVMAARPEITMPSELDGLCCGLDRYRVTPAR